MEIIGEEAHRLLAYVEAVTRQGHVLTPAEFAAYAEGWERKVTHDGPLTASLLALQYTLSTTLFKDQVKTIESELDYLHRLMWLDGGDDRVDITALGKAVLREANSPRSESDTDSTLEVVIDHTNPFAYAQLMAKITTLGDCLIVDPYLDIQQLFTLAEFTNVKRILTGDKDLRAKTPQFSLVLQAASHLELRTVKQGELHDRFVIPGSGNVYMLGSSLSSIAKRFGVATTLEESSSRLIAENYDRIWASGKVMTPHKGPGPDKPPGDGSKR